MDSGGLKTNRVEDKNTTADVNNNTQPGLSFTYMLSDKFGVDLNYTVFFSEDFKGSAGNAYSNLELDGSLGLSGKLGFDDQLNEH